METQEEKNNEYYIDFGFKNFYYNSSSKITLTQIEKDKKDIINLVKKLCSKLSLIESEKLIKDKIEKEIKEEQYNLLNQNESNKDNSNITEKRLKKRNLKYENYWENSFSFNWDIVKTNILGEEFKIAYYVELCDEEITNGLLIKFGWITFKIGNQEGLNKNKKKGSNKKSDLPLGKIPLGCLPASLNLKLGASFDFGVNLQGSIFNVDFSGSLYLRAAVEFGIDNVAKIEAGVKGEFIKVTFVTSFKKNLLTYIIDKGSFEATSGNVCVYATAKVWICTVFSTELEIIKGFKILEIN